MDNIFFLIMIALASLAVLDLVVGVSNDAVNFLNSAIGSKVMSFRNIITLLRPINIVDVLISFLIFILGFFPLLSLLKKLRPNYLIIHLITSLPLVLILLFTSLQGNLIDGANASRWIKLPIIGLSFQPSSMATVILMVYVSFYLSKN